MITIRKAAERGEVNLAWLQSRHSFSFGGYRDPKFKGFRSLRVINEDRVSPGKGFGAHPHRNAEIISIVLSGQLEHKDSLGNGSLIRAGELQRISAGKGISHSEFNPSSDEEVHFYQIWLKPDVLNVEPSYEQQDFSEEIEKGGRVLIASSKGESGSLRINQDAKLYYLSLNEGDTNQLETDFDRFFWVQVMEGSIYVKISGESKVGIQAGDGLSLSKEKRLSFQAVKRSKILLLDLS